MLRCCGAAVAGRGADRRDCRLGGGASGGGAGADRLADCSGANRMLLVEFVPETAGVELARNQIEIAVYDTPTTQSLPKIATTDAAFAAHCAALGCVVVDAESADVTVVLALDATDITLMQAGARYLLI